MNRSSLRFGAPLLRTALAPLGGSATALIVRKGRDESWKFQISRLRLRHLELPTLITPKAVVARVYDTSHVFFIRRCALAHCLLRHLSPAGLGIAAYCSMGRMAPIGFILPIQQPLSVAISHVGEAPIWLMATSAQACLGLWLRVRRARTAP